MFVGRQVLEVGDDRWSRCFEDLEETRIKDQGRSRREGPNQLTRRPANREYRGRWSRWNPRGRRSEDYIILDVRSCCIPALNIPRP